MKINQKKTIQVEAKILRICLKVRDEFCADLVDDKGEIIFSQDDGYVPDFMPGDHYGDYVYLDIDIDSGKVTNWEVPNSDQIDDWMNK